MDAKLDKEYAGITGLADFTKNAAVLAYGKDSKPVKEGRVCADGHGLDQTQEP
jgi:aspartate aminotransferase